LGKNISIVGSHSFDTNEHDHRELIYEMLKVDTDAILLGAVGEPAARVIYQLRALGINKPIIGSDGLDNPKIWEMSGEKAFDTYVASVYLDNPYLKNKNTYTDFYNEYNKKNNRPPDYLARQGYEAVKILSTAFRKSNSTMPITVAATLKYGFDNAFGGYSFDNQGRIVGKDIIMKVMNNGSFHDIKKDK
jgi:branched-chain amino acid transport system substrate-binding protein